MALPVRLQQYYASTGLDPNRVEEVLRWLDGEGEPTYREIVLAVRAEDEERKRLGLERSKKSHEERLARKKVEATNMPPQAGTLDEERGGGKVRTQIVKRSWRAVVDRGPTFGSAEERRRGFNERKKRWRRGKKERKI
jgi:hypothetical protein